MHATHKTAVRKLEPKFRQSNAWSPSRGQLDTHLDPAPAVAALVEPRRVGRNAELAVDHRHHTAATPLLAGTPTR